jgi:hypothetical protein
MITPTPTPMPTPPPPPTEPSTPALGEPRHIRLSLTREVTCIRSLAWRCDLPAAIDWPALAGELATAGLTPRATPAGLFRFGTAIGDEILLVAATGRVQFRVHYTVPHHERKFAAERLFQILVHALVRL